MPSKDMSDDFLNFTGEDWEKLLAEANVENVYKLECLYVYLTSSNDKNKEKDENSDEMSKSSGSSEVNEDLESLKEDLNE